MTLLFAFWNQGQGYPSQGQSGGLWKKLGLGGDDEGNGDVSTVGRARMPLPRLPPNSEQQNQSVGDDEDNGKDQQLLPELSP